MMPYLSGKDIRMLIVCTGDTHGLIPELPEGDVLIYTGDYSEYGDYNELIRFDRYMRSIKDNYKHIIFVPGNHDIYYEKHSMWVKNILQPVWTTLNNTPLTIDGVTFWGSPYTPPFMNWAFMKTEQELRDVFAKIPPKTDVLITHGPPSGILDMDMQGTHAGSIALTDRIHSMRRKPKYHIFGHIHEAYGRYEGRGTTYLNVAHRDYIQNKVNAPVVIEI